MKVLFDGWMFQFQRAGGVNRYFSEIISGLPADWTPVICGTSDFGENAPTHRNLSTVNDPPRFRPRRLHRCFHRRWWKPRLARSVELLHPTYYELTNGLELADFKCPVVTTVYDMIYARFPAQMDHSAALLRKQRESVLRADRVVCISRSTERDLLEFIPEAAGKTVVIHLASSFLVQPSNEENVFAEPTFLYVGGRGGYKNFLFLLRAFASAAAISPSIRLVIAGPPLVPEERWQLYFLGISDRVESVVFPTEEALQCLYRGSVALLYPSRYEGFGIPPLEAMSCNTLAVTANSTSLPEVIGDAGIMLDPTDQNAWTECILKLAQPFRDRATLIERGRARAQQFSWAECAQQHLNIYQQLAGGSKRAFPEIQHRGDSIVQA